MKYFKLFNIALAACAISLSACSDNEPGNDGKDHGEDPGVIEDPKGEMEQYTPAESKDFLESSANEFLSKINPDDQKELIELGSYFNDKYADLEFPYDEDDFRTPVKNLMKNLVRGAKGVNPSTLSRAVKSYVYSIDFSQVAGIYEPKGDEWRRTGDSSDIIVRFTDNAGAACEVKAVASKDQNDEIEFAYEEYDDWYYDYETGEYVDIYNNITVKARVPKNVTVTVTRSGKELVNVQVATVLDIKNHKFTADVNGKVMNLTVTAKTEGNDSRVTENSKVAINGTTVLVTEAAVNGRRLCDKANWERVANDDVEYAVEDFLTNGTAKCDVMGNVQTYVTVSEFTDELVESLDGYWDNYDYNNKAQAEAKAKQAADYVNAKVNAVVKYKGTTTEQAQLRWQPVSYGETWSDYSWWYYELQPIIFFPSDNTTYEVEKYFEKGFQGVINATNDLIDSYSALWE